MKEHDPVERAFELLRRSGEDASPDPALETRLRRRHAELRPRRRRWLIPAVTLVALSGGAMATGGVRWLRGWWYGVEIDGVTLESGALEGDGERTVHFDSDGAGSGTVRVRRESLPENGKLTEIQIARETPGGVEREASLDVAAVNPPKRLHPLSILEDATWLYEGTDALGQALQLFARSDGDGGTRVLVLRPDSEEEAVEEIVLLPLELTSATVEYGIEELADGRLELTVRNGPGAELTFLWSNAASSGALSQEGVSELETPDGAIRVQVGDRPDNR